MTDIKIYFIFVIGYLGINNVNGISHSNATENGPTVIYFRSITSTQEFLVKKFRDENAKLLKDAYFRLDSPIIGFLRASKWDTLAASKYLKKILKWRATNQIDKLEAEEVDPELLRLMPWRLDGSTKQGCPISQVDLGHWLVDEYMAGQQFVHEANIAFRKYYLNGMEKARLAIKNAIPRCDQGISLLDLKNFSFSNLNGIYSLNNVIQLAVNLETYYPNFYSEIICINSSKRFKDFYNSVKHYASQTANIMSLYTEAEAEQAKEHILSIVDASQLPPQYFGCKNFTI